jgi:hypothetical protein
MKLSLLFVLFFAVNANIIAQMGKNIATVTLSDTDNKAKEIPFIGEKVVMIQYTDPDVKDVNDKLSDAVRAKKFPKEGYQGIGIANCKDTWFPNSAIRSKSRQKEKQFPGSVILLDEKHILSDAWQLGDCNGCGVVIVVGKDKVVRFFRKIKTEEESQAAIAEVLKVLDKEIL